MKLMAVMVISRVAVDEKHTAHCCLRSARALCCINRQRLSEIIATRGRLVLPIIDRVAAKEFQRELLKISPAVRRTSRNSRGHSR